MTNNQNPQNPTQEDPATPEPSTQKPKLGFCLLAGALARSAAAAEGEARLAVRTPADTAALSLVRRDDSGNVLH